MSSLHTYMAATATALPQDLGTEIDAFLLDRDARQCSPATLGWYAEKLGIFADFASETGVRTAGDLAPTAIRKYLLSLRTNHNKGGQHGLYRALRAFLNWWERETEPENWTNPLAKVPAPKASKEIQEPVLMENVWAMYSTCPTDTKLGCRDRAILLALIDSGCRASEFIALSFQDVDLQTGACHVRHGKGDKGRVVFLGEQSRAALRTYLAFRPEAAENAPLWTTRDETRLTYSGLRQIVRRRADKAGVPTPSLHSFRRGFALGCLRQGIDPFSLQRLLGHSDLTMVRRYLLQTTDDLARAHEACGPVDHGPWGDDGASPSNIQGGHHA